VSIECVRSQALRVQQPRLEVGGRFQVSRHEENEENKKQTGKKRAAPHCPALPRVVFLKCGSGRRPSPMPYEQDVGTSGTPERRNTARQDLTARSSIQLMEETGKFVTRTHLTSFTQTKFGKHQRMNLWIPHQPTHSSVRAASEWSRHGGPVWGPTWRPASCLLWNVGWGTRGLAPACFLPAWQTNPPETGNDRPRDRETRRQAQCTTITCNFFEVRLCASAGCLRLCSKFSSAIQVIT
jgi:hypothetical protein